MRPDDIVCVERPRHYNPGSTYEPIKIIEAYDLNFNLGNVIKYILRPTKGQHIEDLQKARQYINFEIERIVNNSGRIVNNSKED